MLSRGCSDCLRLQEDAQAKVDQWVADTQMNVDVNVVVVKPAEGGSSLGVTFSHGLKDAVRAARDCLLGGSEMVRRCSHVALM